MFMDRDTFDVLLADVSTVNKLETTAIAAVQHSAQA